MKAGLVFFRILIAAIGLASASFVAAQTLPGIEPPPEEIVTEPTADPFGRETPRGSITGLLRALADGDYLRASQYFPTEEGLGAEAESEVSEDGADASAAEAAAAEAFKLHARIRADAVSIVAELPENAELIINQKDR